MSKKPADTSEVKISVRRGLEIIHNLCDGAYKIDGVGFNKFHRPIVDSLLSKERWTPSQLNLAQRILQVYKGQLAGVYGIDFNSDVDPSLDDIYEEKKIDSPKVAYIYPAARKAIFQFPYDETILNDLKSTFYQRRFSRDVKAWTVWGDPDYLEEFAKKHGFQITYRNDPRGEIILKDGVFIIKSDYDPYLVEKLKKMGGSWSKRKKVWKISFSPNVLKDLKELIDMGLIITSIDDVNEEIQKFEQSIKLSQKSFSDFDVKLKGGSLLPYQRAGVEYIVQKKKVLLADVMGLGKTIQAIAAVEHLKAYPVLVVCPASLKLNWEKEIQKWSWNPQAVVIDSGEILKESRKNGSNSEGVILQKIKEKNWVIINYDILNKFKEALKKYNFKSVILDESHYIKNPKAQRTKAALEILDTLRENLDLIILLSGTPMTARPLDLIPQLKALGVMKKITRTVTEFRERYMEMDIGPWGVIYKGAKNLDDLNKRLRAVCMVRREKEDVLKELPHKIRTYVPMEISKNYREEYYKAVTDIVAYMVELSRKEGLSNKELKQVAKRTLRGEVLVKITKAQEILGEAKVQVAKEWISNFFENNPQEKLVVFAIHKHVQKSLYEYAKNKGWNPARIFGDDPTSIREENVNKFQNDPSCRIIIVSVKAGGVGITLTAAAYALFVELDWVPANLAQAEDRLHRIGQKNTVFIYYLIVPDTIDERIMKIVEEKRQITEEGISYTSAENMLLEIQKFFKKIKKRKKTYGLDRT